MTQFPYSPPMDNTLADPTWTPTDTVEYKEPAIYTQSYVDDLITRQNTAQLEKDELIERLRNVNSDMNLVKSRIWTEFQEFKSTVRQALIDADGIRMDKKTINRMLTEELDLPGTEIDYNVEVMVSQTFMVTVTADSEEAAIEAVQEMGNDDILHNADDWDWDVETTGNVEETR
jgi:hypothetical protein